MKQLKTLSMRGWGVAGACLLVAGVAAWQANAVSVYYEGTLMSKRGRLIDGEVFVPAKDLATALKHQATYDKVAKTLNIDFVGGQNQEEGVSGKPGESLFNGLTRMRLEPGTKPAGAWTAAFEVRNAGAKPKYYKFGFGSTDYKLFDAANNSVKGEIANNTYYSMTLAPAAPQRVELKFAVPEGFDAVKMVFRITTQISGQDPKQEIFRFDLTE